MPAIDDRLQRDYESQLHANKFAGRCLSLNDEPVEGHLTIRRFGEVLVSEVRASAHVLEVQETRKETAETVFATVMVEGETAPRASRKVAAVEGWRRRSQSAFNPLHDHLPRTYPPSDVAIAPRQLHRRSVDGRHRPPADTRARWCRALRSAGANAKLAPLAKRGARI